VNGEGLWRGEMPNQLITWQIEEIAQILTYYLETSLAINSPPVGIVTT